MLSKLNARIFNLGLAAFAAASVAIFFLAMPADLFEGLVDGTGLPIIVSAAAPPLGWTARLVTMAVAGLGTFLLIWSLLRALDAPAPVEAEDGYNWQPSRLRRADAHPDAPARRPLLARHEFGELGLEPIGPEANGADAADADGEAEQPLDEDVADEIFEPTPIASQDIAPVPAQAAESLITKLAPPVSPAEETPESPVAEQADATEDQKSTEALAALLPLPDAPGGSLVALLDRLETGVDSIEWPVAGMPVSPAASEPLALSEDRLRNVLDDLQRLAARS